MPDATPIGIAVIGYGYWSPKLIRNIKNDPGFSLIAICEKDRSRHAAIRAEQGNVTIEDEYRSIFARTDIDAVIVATIPSSHFRIAKLALEAGKHVLVEKPLTLSVAQGDMLLQLARRKHLTLMVDHTYLYSPAIRSLQSLVRDGTFGKIYSIESVRVNLGLFQRDSNVVWDLAPHDVSILLSLFDEKPYLVSVVGSKTVIHASLTHGQESVAHMMLYYRSGLIAHIYVSWISPLKARQITLIGSERMAVYDQLASDQLRVFDHGVYASEQTQESGPLFAYKMGTIETVAIPSGGEDLAAMLADFRRAIREGTTPVSNGMLGLNVVRILAAAQQSLERGGKKVRISYRSPHPLLQRVRNLHTRVRHGY
ncbi:MAG TPA: Gfo/Idh/MocA family oxidoreductase [Candidatus Paceibacterota bacterium]|nr:Gfo/Idh/MocA family oxidoreductase [Candidatus Paceibacterota bacterium]